MEEEKGEDERVQGYLAHKKLYPYRGTSPIMKRLPLGPCSRPLPRVL